MDLELTGKIALVTGGSRGIGRAIGLSLAREGARVVLLARTEEDVEKAARNIEETTGSETLALTGDVTRVSDIEQVVETARSTFGGVDILVSNAAVAGGDRFRPPRKIDDSDVMKDIETKFLGALRAARALAPHMQRKGWGRVIAIAGLSAPYSSSYATERKTPRVPSTTRAARATSR